MKTSDMFEGRNSSLRKTFEAVAPDTLDLKCSCGCGQRVRFAFHLKSGNDRVLDISILQKGEKSSDKGVVLDTSVNKDYERMLKFIK